MLNADKAAFSAVRVLVNMNQTGEVAGVASALAFPNNQSIQELDPGSIRKKLAADGLIMI